MQDLRSVDCDLLTIGQYLRPSPKHHTLVKFYTPQEFDQLREEGERLGFRHVASGPLVRSSYHADEQSPLPDAERFPATAASMSSSTPNLVLYNANVITLDASMPRASWVAAKPWDDSRRGFGPPSQGPDGPRHKSNRLPGRDAGPWLPRCPLPRTGCGGLPAGSRLQPGGRLIHRRYQGAYQGARRRCPAGRLDTRGGLHNEFYLREKRHPTRWDLDAPSLTAR